MKPNNRKTNPLSWDLVDKAKTGNEGAIRHLLGVFCETVKTGGTFDPVLLQYFADAFSSILYGDSKDGMIALGVVRKGSGRPKKPRLPRADSLAAQNAWKLAEAVHDLLGTGTQLSYAYQEVAGKQKVSVMKVRRAWKDWGKAVNVERQIRSSVHDLLVHLIEFQQSGRVAGMRPKTTKSFRTVMSGLGNFLPELERAIPIWRIWIVGLVSDEMYQLGHSGAVRFCEAVGTVSAIDWPEISPEDGWTKALQNLQFKFLMDIWKSSPAENVRALATDSELRDAWLKGFRTVRNLTKLD